MRQTFEQKVDGSSSGLYHQILFLKIRNFNPHGLPSRTQVQLGTGYWGPIDKTSNKMVEGEPLDQLAFCWGGDLGWS